MMARKQAEELSYGIIRLGRFGSVLTSTLAEAGKEIMVPDCNEEKVRQIRNFTEHTYVVKDLWKETLREIGVQNCDVMMVCIGDKVDVSILTTLDVINLGVPQVVAKANSPGQREILEKIGAQVVYPEKDMALRLARRFISKRVSNLFELDHNIDISEFELTSQLVGQTVLEAQLRNRYGVNIIAISHGGWLATDITPDYTLAEGDTLMVIGERDKTKRLEDALQKCSIDMAKKAKGLQ